MGSGSGSGSASPVRNFTLTVGERINALVAGPPAWSLRLRQIEDLEAELSQEARKPTAHFERKLALLNSLIDKHNRYYPIEANLPYHRPFEKRPFHTRASLRRLASPR